MATFILPSWSARLVSTEADYRRTENCFHLGGENAFIFQQAAAARCNIKKHCNIDVTPQSEMLNVLFKFEAIAVVTY